MKDSGSLFTRIIVFVFLVTSFFLLLSFFTVCCLMLVYRDHEEQRSLREYQKFRFNHLTNESSAGIVSTFEQIDDGDSLYIEDEIGNHILISNFDTPQFVCTGVCVCRGKTSRRTVIAASEGIIYLVAALTSLIAYEQAKIYFREKCLSEFDDDDDEEECTIDDFIDSEVRDCDFTDEERMKRFPTGKPISLDNIDEAREKLKKRKKYLCRGNCLTKNFDFKKEFFELENADLHLYKVDCEKIKVEAVINADISGAKPEEYQKRVKKEFQWDYLLPLCRERGWVKVPHVIDYYEMVEEGDSPVYEGMVDVFFCTSHNDFWNPTIKCVPVEDKEPS